MSRKIKPLLSEKQAKYVQARFNGHNKRQSKLIAGYSDNNSTSQIENGSHIQKPLLAACTKAGLTEDYLAKKLMQNTNAHFIHYSTYKGSVSQFKSPDFGVRDRAVRTVLELRGDLKNNVIDQLNIGVIHIPGSSENWDKENAVEALYKEEAKTDEAKSP